MKTNKNNQSEEKSLVDRLIIPVLIALLAGGTAPWWIDIFRSNEEVASPEEPTELGGSSIDDSLNITGDNNTVSDDSTNAQSNGNQTVIEGTGNNVTQSNSIPDNPIVNPPPPGTFHNDDSLNIQGSGNTVNDNSVNAQSGGDQVVVTGSENNIVQGTGNTVLQGTGNQLTIQQESEARARGEFDIPAISGQTYHDARQKLIDEGWTPLTQRHFYPQEEPGIQYGSGKTFWDLGYWEIVSCSGSAEGFCRFEFADPSGRKLVVVTAGMEDPSIPAYAMINRVFFEDESNM